LEDTTHQKLRRQADWAVCSDCCSFSPIAHQGENDDEMPTSSVGLGVKADMVQIVLLAEATASRCQVHDSRLADSLLLLQVDTWACYSSSPSR